jgi:elongation factor G
MDAKERIRKIRNLGVIAHIDAGKTTTTERILFFSGASHKIGEVDAGTAIMDWMDQERERGITITSAVITTSWQGHTLNLVDTPGHVDFTAEVQRSLRVLDGAVIVICGVAGVEPQSEKVWHQAKEFRVPRIVFVNKLDRIGADFGHAMADLEKKLGGTFVPLLIPVHVDAQSLSAIDVLDGTLLVWEGEGEDDAPKSLPLPEDLIPRLSESRERLVEAVGAWDEKLLDDLLDRGTLDKPRAILALRQATLTGDVHPLLAGAALKNRGIRRLLDSIVDYLPSPLDVRAVEGTKPSTGETLRRNPNPDIPLAALVYKVMNDESHNRLYYTRIYSGTLEKGEKIWNTRKGVEERAGRIYRMHSNKKVAIEQAMAGDIVALVGFKKTTTGDTLCAKEQEIMLEPIEFPNPVISAAIEPKNQADLDNLERALSELTVEDPTFMVHEDPDTGQRIISGMGELHLEVLVDRIRREHGIEARVGQPQVSYRETITKESEADGRFEREIAEKMHRALVRLRLSPGEKNSGFQFQSEIDSPLISDAALRWIEDSARASMASGSFAGYPLIDIRVQLTGAELPPESATEIAVRGAAADAFRHAASKGGVVLLEPVVRLEVMVPGEYAGEVLRDLNARHAQVTGVESRGATERAQATVPLSRMFGYATDLRSLTRGRGIFAMEVSHFEPALEAMQKFH